MNNSKKFFLVITLLLLGASLIVTNAQSEAKKSAKEKLSKVEGDVSSIIVKTSDGEVEFTAEEAEYLLKKMKADKMIISSHGGKIIEMNTEMHTEGDENVIFIQKKVDGDGTKKKINVEEEDGVKTVTVTTTKDGEKTIETYEGEEAEKFLDSMHEEHGLSMHGEDIINIDAFDIKISEGDEDVYIVKKIIDKDGNIEIDVTTDADGEHVFIHKESGDDIEWTIEECEDKVKKEINVEEKDGVKTLTVTTTEDGEEKVEVFTGDEADEYLEKMHEEDGMKIEKKKTIRIEYEEEDEGEEGEHEEDEEEHDDD